MTADLIQDLYLNQLKSYKPAPQASNVEYFAVDRFVLISFTIHS